MMTKMTATTSMGELSMTQFVEEGNWLQNRNGRDDHHGASF
jgi:hypothetical protein